MRSSALIALLPLLATLSIAHPHHHHSHHRHSSRKTLGFGPSHKHATFELLSVEPVNGEISIQGLSEIDVKTVASRFIGDKIGSGEGVGYYIRPDVSPPSLHGRTELIV